MSARRFNLGGLCAMVGFLCIIVGAGLSHADEEFPRDVLKGIEAMRRLPAEGFHVVESQGRLLLVSTNGHYVVSGGRLLDLWNQLEVKRVSDLDRTLRLPLSRMGINAATLGGLVVNETGAQGRVTVFLDPGSPESRKLLPVLRTLSTSHRVELIFVPAQPARAGVSQALICNPSLATTFFEQGAVPEPQPEPSSCGREGLERARVTVQLLGIQTLPFTVAGNGVTSAGIAEHYADFVKTNQEARR
jgi:thiol:disulfide interchange protein DsbC